MGKLTKVTLETAVTAWLDHCRTAKSKNTVAGYSYIGRLFIDHMGGERLIAQIDIDDIERFIREVGQAEVAPDGIAPRPARKLAAKTIANYHTGLSSLWTWATSRGLVTEHVVRAVKPPKVHEKPINPLSGGDILKLIRACDVTRAWHNDPLVQAQRPTALRDRMIVYLLLDTCIRASEACHLRLADVTLRANGGEVYVREGKGGKDRIVPFGRRAARAVEAYLLTRPGAKGEDWLLINELRNYGHPLTRNTLGRLVKRLGERAGLKRRIGPHLLRTTGACMLAANGMGEFYLQRVMGHKDIGMTLRYIAAARMKMEQAMATASPIDNLRL
jgi:integrase/recombinase XerD